MTFPSFDDKDPSDVLEYQFDWSDWLGTGETISSYTVTVDTGLTLDSDRNTSTSVYAFLSGGTLGETYNVNCEIVTSASQTKQQTATITIASN